MHQLSISPGNNHNFATLLEIKPYEGKTTFIISNSKHCNLNFCFISLGDSVLVLAIASNLCIAIVFVLNEIKVPHRTQPLLKNHTTLKLFIIALLEKLILL